MKQVESKGMKMIRISTDHGNAHFLKCDIATEDWKLGKWNADTVGCIGVHKKRGKTQMHS